MSLTSRHFEGLEKRFSVSVPADLCAKLDDAARKKGNSRTSFVEWCISQVLDLGFLSAADRDFIRGIVRELGGHWDDLSVISVIITSARQGIREGKLAPTFFVGVGPKPAVKDGRETTVSPAPSRRISTGG